MAVSVSLKALLEGCCMVGHRRVRRFSNFCRRGHGRCDQRRRLTVLLDREAQHGGCYEADPWPKGTTKFSF